MYVLVGSVKEKWEAGRKGELFLSFVVVEEEGKGEEEWKEEKEDRGWRVMRVKERRRRKKGIEDLLISSDRHPTITRLTPEQNSAKGFGTMTLP